MWMVLKQLALATLQGSRLQAPSGIALGTPRPFSLLPPQTGNFPPHIEGRRRESSISPREYTVYGLWIHIEITEERSLQSRTHNGHGHGLRHVPQTTQRKIQTRGHREMSCEPWMWEKEGLPRNGHITRRLQFSVWFGCGELCSGWWTTKHFQPFPGYRAQFCECLAANDWICERSTWYKWHYLPYNQLGIYWKRACITPSLSTGM